MRACAFGGSKSRFEPRDGFGSEVRATSRRSSFDIPFKKKEWNMGGSTGSYPLDLHEEGDVSCELASSHFEVPPLENWNNFSQPPDSMQHAANIAVLKLKKRICTSFLSI
jgi:hypothetical protein